MKTFSRKIRRYSNGKIFAVIYLTAVVVLTCSVFIAAPVLHIQLKGDWWFEISAKKIAEGKPATITWGIGENPDMPTDYNLQKGEYENWRPIGYSLFLTVPALFENFETAKKIWQILFYSLLPALFFLFAEEYFKNLRNGKTVAFCSAVIFVFYPKFLFSPLQTIDTWLIALFVLISAVLLIKLYMRENFRYVPLFALSLVMLMFLRVTAVAPFIPIYLAIVFKRKLFSKPIMVFSPLIAIVTLFAFFSVSQNGNVSIITTNLGYNLWLGNHPASNDFLRKHWGDCSSIEDALLPKSNNEFRSLISADENIKNAVLTETALQFMKDHPAVTFENSLLKFVGFWSPIRMRDNADGNLKEVINAIVELPMVLSFFLYVIYSLISGFKREWTIIALIFISVWMIPNVLFISSDRFRTPIEFILILFTVELYFILRNMIFRQKTKST